MGGARHPQNFEPFFQHLTQGRLAFPRCRSCGRNHWYPMKRCPHCRSAELEWSPVRGDGTVFSWTVVRHPFDPGLADELPYIVALIEFDDAPGVRLVAHLEAAPDEVAIGMPVVPVFRTEDGRPPAVRFRPGQHVDRPTIPAP